MNVYTPLGALFVVLALLALMKMPIFSAADKKWHDSSSRTLTIDGLRGYLAIGVFIHHAVIYYQFLVEGKWDNPPSTLYTQLGPVGVSLFFMITGYLFWGKIIQANGRPKWIPLYVGRLFRIGPVYFLTMSLMLALIFIETQFTFQEPPLKVLTEVSSLLFFGVFEPARIINGSNSGRLITAAVTWTLRFEWIFYLILLPISALFARSLKNHLTYSASVLIICLSVSLFKNSSPNSLLLAAFFIGMVCASMQAIDYEVKVSDKAMSGIALTALFFIFFEPFPVNDTFRTLLLGVVFLLTVNGSSFFGLLTSQSAQRLGEISYGIYLLQGIVLFTFSQSLEIKSFAISTPIAYWVYILIEAIALIHLAYFAYYFIEKPGIKLGKKVSLYFSK